MEMPTLPADFERSPMMGPNMLAKQHASKNGEYVEFAQWPITYATVNLEELRKLPVEQCPGREISNSLGSACSMDPPGYPTYFIQHVYTRSGNEPSYGVTAVIYDPERHNYHGIAYAEDWHKYGSWDEIQKAHDELMRRLWKPLPYKHERNWEWMRHVYAHFHHTYRADKQGKYGGKFKFWGPGNFSREKMSVQEARLYFGQAMYNLGDPEITISRHYAVHYIRRWYPDHEPIHAFIIETPSKMADYESNNRWWEHSDLRAPYGTLVISGRADAYYRAY